MINANRPLMNSGISIVRSVGEKGEKIIQAFAESAEKPSMTIVQHPPFTRGPIEIEPGYSRIAEISITDVTKGDGEPKQIMLAKNRYFRGGKLQRTEVSSLNELTGRMIAVTDFAENKNLFSEASVVSTADAKDFTHFDYFNGKWVKK